VKQKTLLLFFFLAFVGSIILISWLYHNNRCTEGGITLQRCNCAGIKVLREKEPYVDGLQHYSCIGVLK